MSLSSEKWIKFGNRFYARKSNGGNRHIVATLDDFGNYIRIGYLKLEELPEEVKDAILVK